MSDLEVMANQDKRITVEAQDHRWKIGISPCFVYSANQWNLLKREYLVNEIWNDYGGGDEALTQSISVNVYPSAVSVTVH